MASGDVEAVDYDLDLTFKDDTNIKEARGVNPVTFNYTVEHTGDELSEEVLVQFYNVSHRWQIVVAVTTITDVYLGTYSPARPTDFVITRGEIAKMIVTVTPPVNERAGIYWMNVDVWPRNNMTNSESHDFAVVISQYASFEIALHGPKVDGQIPPDRTYGVIPPAGFGLQFAVYNTGNGDDRFKIQGTSSRDLDGWVLNFTGGVDAYGFTPNLTADPDKHAPHVINVTVTIPPGVDVGTTCQIAMAATSELDPSKQVVPASATIKALQTFNVSVEYDAPADTVHQGQRISFGLNVTNTGNGLDVFDITAELEGTGADGLSVIIEPGALKLDEGERGRATVSVDVPEDAELALHHLIILVASTLNETNELASSFAFEVLEAHGVSLTAEVSTNSTVPGGSVELMVKVENTGIYLDAFLLETQDLPSKWTASVQPPEVMLLSGQHVIIAIVVTVPADIELAPIGLHRFRVSVHSTRSHAGDSLMLSVEVCQFFRVEWMRDGEPLTSPKEPVNNAPVDAVEVNPIADGLSSLTLDIFNFGNGLDNVTLGAIVTDGPLLIGLDPELMPVPSRTQGSVSVLVKVPKNTPTGSYEVRLTADSQDPLLETRVVAFRVIVHHIDVALPTYPTYLTPDGDGTVVDRVQLLPGEEASFQLDVMNNGTVPATNVLIRGWDVHEPEGDETRELIFEHTIDSIPVGDRFTIGGRGHEGAPSIAWGSEVTGVHELVFEAVLANQADTTNDRSSVRVVVKDPPEVRVDDERIVVTEGDELVVTGTVEDDVGDIEWVKVRVDDGNWTEANGTTEWSVEIDTDQLEPGVHTLKAVASDGHTESPVLNTTFEVDPRFTADDTPGFGLVPVLAAVLAAVVVVVRWRSR